jgi:hypothetical protein
VACAIYYVCDTYMGLSVFLACKQKPMENDFQKHFKDTCGSMPPLILPCI